MAETIAESGSWFRCGATLRAFVPPIPQAPHGLAAFHIPAKRRPEKVLELREFTR